MLASVGQGQALEELLCKGRPQLCSSGFTAASRGETAPVWQGPKAIRGPWLAGLWALGRVLACLLCVCDPAPTK